MSGEGFVWLEGEVWRLKWNGCEDGERYRELDCECDGGRVVPCLCYSLSRAIPMTACLVRLSSRRHPA